VLESRRHAVDAGTKLFVADAMAVIDQGLPVGIGLRPLGQGLIKGLCTPMA
jgi:hypothetical protein